MRTANPKRKRSAWFAFYADDYVGGTRRMTLSERGAFTDLLSHQWLEGAIPDDDDEICRLIGAFPEEWQKVKSKVLRKFVLTDAGYVNERLEKERDEREGIRKKRVDAATKRWEEQKAREAAQADANAQAKADSNGAVLLHASTATATASTTSLSSSNSKIEDASAAAALERTIEPAAAAATPSPSQEKGKDWFAIFAGIAPGLGIPEDFAAMLAADVSANDGNDATGKPVKAPGSFLKASWDRERVRTAERGSGAAQAKPAQKNGNAPGERSAWQIEGDIARLKRRIAQIEAEPGNRNSANGYTETERAHRERLEPEWFRFLVPLAEEFREKLPEDWATFQAELAEKKARLTGDNAALYEDPEVILAELAERFPKDVPTFDRWSRDFAKQPWTDPAKLTDAARAEIAQLKERVAEEQSALGKVLRNDQSHRSCDDKSNPVEP